jgi:hypothetical protein
VTRDQAKSLLVEARQWLDGAGTELSGAEAAKLAITSLLMPFTAGALGTPEDEHEIVEMIVREAHFRMDPATPKRQRREVEDAVASAIAVALKNHEPQA